MRTISCKLEDLKTMTLHIGYEGENDYTSVRIDAGSVFAQYPEAVPSLKVQPPKGNMYPVIVTRDGDIVIWNVSDSDTASNGNGEIQLTFTENTVVVKSCTGKTLVHRSLKATGPAPDPLIDFIDRAEEVVGEAQDAAEEAEAAAQHAPMIGLDGYWYKWDAETEGYVKTDTKARGEDGANGVGITSVEKISTVGLVDTYRINFTNGTNTTYTVTNGQDGSVPIDDTTPAANKVFSSAKVAEMNTQLLNEIQGKPETVNTDEEDADLDITDNNGYVIARFSDGHVKTKNFDSSDERTNAFSTDEQDADLDIVDNDGNVIARFVGGGIKTKNFSSSEIKERLSDAENGLDALAEAIGTGFSVPDYWISTLTTKEQDINDLNNGIGANGVTFLFFTDYHQNTNNGKSLQLMLHVLNHTSVRDVFYGGDTSDGGSLPNTAAAEAKLREVANHLRPLNMLAIRGNHDCEPSATSTTNQIPEEAYYDMYVRPIEKEIKGTGKPYYYLDNETAKVRYICMDSGSRLTDTLDATQITWFKSKLTELQSGWTVIIFQHMVYENVNTASQTLITMGQSLLNAIDDVYSNLNCEIAAVIAGHCHTDAIISTNYNFKVITTTCDSGGANAETDPLYPTRTPGTTNEQAFDVFTVDTVNKTINITRIGAGIDRSTTY